MRAEFAEAGKLRRGGARIRIVYLIWNLKAAGAERQLLQLIGNLDPTLYEPHLVLFKRGPMDAECACPVTYVRTTAPLGGRTAAGVTTFVRLLRVLRALRPDVLHSFLPEIVHMYGAVAAKLLRIPVFVCNRRASVGLYRRSRWLRVAEKFALKLTDAMAVNAECLREELVWVDGYAPERVSLIANGVDTERFRPDLPSRASQFGWPGTCIVIGMVANFRPCKRHEDFLRAAALVRETRPAARFLLVGNDAGSLERVKQLIEQLQLHDSVRVVTGCSQSEEYLGSMHILACTSESEGLSNAILEAMACGLPILATRAGGNAEIVRDGVEGLLVPVRAPSAVAEAIRALIDGAEMRERMGIAGRQRAVAHFSTAAMVSAYQDLYEGLLAGRIETSPATMEPAPARERIGQ